MGAGSYCRGTDSPQALTRVTSSCAHDTQENSSYLQPGTWAELATEVPSTANGEQRGPSRFLPPVLAGHSPLLITGL